MFLITGYIIIVVTLALIGWTIQGAIQSQREDARESIAREARIRENLAAREARRAATEVNA